MVDIHRVLAVGCGMGKEKMPLVAELQNADIMTPRRVPDVADERYAQDLAHVRTCVPDTRHAVQGERSWHQRDCKLTSSYPSDASRFGEHRNSHDAPRRGVAVAGN